MTTRPLPELISAALTGASDATEALHERCEDFATARQACEILLATMPKNSAAVEEWLYAIVEMQPELAAPVGRELLAKLGIENRQGNG